MSIPIFLKTPKFWHKRSFISYLLLPLSMLYLLGHYLNCWRKISYNSKIPVICIGNLTSGGAGKTPVAIAIGKILKNANIDFAFLSSGYGGRIKDFTEVKREIHKSQDVGDEPLMLAESGSAFVCKNRVIGAKQIEKLPEKKLIILDDGFQNPSVKKDFSILVIDGNYGFGNGFVLPSGSLREPIGCGIKKADLIIIIGEDKFQISEKFSNKKIIKTKTRFINYDKFIDKNVVAFCGIGRPEKFFDNLEKSKIKAIEKLSFPDHHQYLDSEIEEILKISKEKNLAAITTKKDWVRLDDKHKDQISYLDIVIEFEDEDYLKNKILSLIINH